jgi:hypothetical protein
MKRFAVTLLVLAAACAWLTGPKIPVVYAQLPSARPTTWTQLIDATHPGPDGYRIAVNNVVQKTVPPCTPVATSCADTATVTTAGTNTVSVTSFVNTTYDPNGNVLIAGGDGNTLSWTFTVKIPGNSSNLIIK